MKLKELTPKTRNLRSKQYREFKIKWMDKNLDDTIWEIEENLKTKFPQISLQECSVLKGEYVMGIAFSFNRKASL